MSTVNDILLRKGSEVLTINIDTSVLDAAEVMNEHKIGALIVIEDGDLVGIFTERDVLQRVVAEQLNPVTTTVGDAMSTQVACCTPETSLDEASTVMKNRRIRHLPVVDQRKSLLGMISIGDLNAFHAHTQEKTIHFLHQYLYGDMT